MLIPIIVADIILEKYSLTATLPLRISFISSISGVIAFIILKAFFIIVIKKAIETADIMIDIMIIPIIFINIIPPLKLKNA